MSSAFVPNHWQAPQREIVTLRGGAEGGSEFGYAEQLVKRLTDSLTALSVRGRLNLHSWTWLVSFSYPVRVAAAREGYNVYCRCEWDGFKLDTYLYWLKLS